MRIPRHIRYGRQATADAPHAGRVRLRLLLANDDGSGGTGGDRLRLELIDVGVVVVVRVGVIIVVQATAHHVLGQRALRPWSRFGGVGEGEPSGVDDAVVAHQRNGHLGGLADLKSGYKTKIIRKTNERYRVSQLFNSSHPSRRELCVCLVMTFSHIKYHQSKLCKTAAQKYHIRCRVLKRNIPTTRNPAYNYRALK